jgi:hypothetical protein
VKNHFHEFDHFNRKNGEMLLSKVFLLLVWVQIQKSTPATIPSHSIISWKRCNCISQPRFFLPEQLILRGGSHENSGEQTTVEMFNWNGKLYALHKSNGTADCFVDVENGSKVWNRSQPETILRHILEQARPTQRTKPFSVKSAESALSAPIRRAEMLSEILNSPILPAGESTQHDATGVDNNGVDGTSPEDPRSSTHETQGDKMIGIDAEEDEDTEAELYRTLDEVLPEELKNRLLETGILR